MLISKINRHSIRQISSFILMIIKECKVRNYKINKNLKKML